jgi:hypothetical protein
MKKIAWAAAIISVLVGFFLWPVPQMREASRQEELRQQAAEIQRKVEAAEAAHKASVEMRAKQRSAIGNASDASLKSLIGDCQRKISDSITAKASPSFAVYFPDYDADDLAKLTAMGFTMNSPTGRPSVLLNRDDFEVRQIDALKRYPDQISIVAESASDTFSGVKKWATNFDCKLDGLSIKSVNQAGAYNFF